MPALSTHIGIVNTEPVITLDGQRQDALTTGLRSLTVSETLEGLYRCEAKFNNWGNRGQGGPDFLYFDQDSFGFGQVLAISLNAGSAHKPVFNGTISAIEGVFLSGEAPQIQIMAEDAAQGMRQTRRTRTFEEVSDKEVMEQIAGEYGLQSDIKLSDYRYSVVAQLNQSDLAFMRERARRQAAEIWIEGNTLYVQERQKRSQDNEPLTLTMNAGLLEFCVLADTANQYSQVSVSGWDVQTKEKIVYTATESALGNEGRRQVTGATIVRNVFGDRTDRIAQQMPLSYEETKAIAEASFRAQARRFVVGKGVAVGDARIRVGRAITFEALGSWFSGVYTVCEVQHQFCRGPDGGYTTEFVVERAGLNKDGGNNNTR